MSDDSKGELPDVETWLKAATRRLCDVSRERIRREITDHYESAREAALADGASASAARRSALRALGDPAEAGRAFRRTNLTRIQAALVRGMGERSARGILALHVVLLASAIGVVAVFANSPARRTIGLVSLLLMTGALVVVHLWTPRSYRRGRVKAAVLGGALGNWLFYAAMCVGLPFSTDGESGPVAAVVYGAILATLLLLYLPLIGKVRRGDLQASSVP